MSEIIVSVKNVKKTYQQGSIEVHALRGVTLELEKGDFAVLAGSSGSGKTTLLNLVGALDVATSGEIAVEGRTLSTMSGKELAELRLRRLGFVFQAYNLIPVLSAYENAEYVMLLQGAPEERRHQKVMNVLESVGLQGLEKRRPTELSGGQQQRRGGAGDRIGAGTGPGRRADGEPRLPHRQRPGRDDAQAESGPGHHLPDLLPRSEGDPPRGAGDPARGRGDRLRRAAERQGREPQRQAQAGGRERGLARRRRGRRRLRRGRG